VKCINFIKNTNAAGKIAQTVVKSLVEIKLFFLVLAERPKEAPESAIEKRFMTESRSVGMKRMAGIAPK
jgi:hypothetical protein